MAGNGNEWLIEDILPSNEVHLIGGPSGAGKTTWLFQMLQQWQEGMPIFRHKSHPVPYAYVSIDRSIRSVNRTLKRLRIDPSTVPTAPTHGLREIKDVTARVRQQHPDTQVIIIEGFASLVPGGKINDYQAVAQFMIQCTRICEQFGITIIGLVHAAKTKEGETYLNPRQKIAGSVSWAAYSETIIYIDTVEGTDALVQPVMLKILPRNSAEETYELERDGQGWLVPAQKRESKSETAVRTIVGTIKEDEFTRWDLRNHLGSDVSERTITRVISRMIEQGLIMRVREGVFKKIKPS